MKILICYASAGAGHFKAAEAIYEGLKKYTDHEAVLSDVLDHTSPQYKRMYAGTYTFLISKIPLLWGFFFNLLDQPWLQAFVKRARRIYNHVNTGPFVRYIRKENFDYIISTHFMSTEVVSALKEEGLIFAKLITVVTDYDVHRIWLADCSDFYAVATSHTKEKLVSLGVKINKIHITGIPTAEKFSGPFDMAALKNKLGLEKDVFTVLIATGSFGIGPIEEIIKVLEDFQVVVICGHNKGLYERLNKKKIDHVKVFGLVDNMHEMMAVSDVMVTKPGGLSISEALVSQLPLIFFNAIPGQEANNIMVLKKYGIGISGCSIEEIAKKLKEFQASKDTFISALKKTQTVARPSAVKDIINLIK